MADGLERSYGWEPAAALRLRFVLDFADGTGPRASEFVGATLGQIETDEHDDHWLQMVGKGSNAGKVALAPLACGTLNRSLAHGLNINFLRKWLGGRDIKRTGLPALRIPTRMPPPPLISQRECPCVTAESPRGTEFTHSAVRLQMVPLRDGKLLNPCHEVLVCRGVSRSSPSGWRHAQPGPQGLLQADVADVQVHMIAVAKGRTPARVELDLQEVVEAVVDVVLRFGAATVATELKDKRLRPDIFDPHVGS